MTPKILLFLSQDVYFRATQLGLDSLAKTARQTAQQIPLRGEPMTSDQLKLLDLVSSESQHAQTTSSPRLLGGWDERDGQLQGGDWLEDRGGDFADRLASMKFDTSNGTS